MKVLIYAGIAPGITPSIEELLTKKYDCGGNVGNLMFINAVAESINIQSDIEFIPTQYRADFTDAEIDWINSEFSYFILPLADAFRNDNIKQLHNLSESIKKLRIPCVVIGVGLRAPLYNDFSEKHDFDFTVSEFINAVLDKSSTVGLRGENTAKYLNKLGYQEGKHYRVIGCPSMCMAAFGGLEIKELSSFENLNIAVNGNDLAPENINIFFRKTVSKNANSVIIQQREAELMDLYLSRYSEIGNDFFRKQGSIYGIDLYNKMLSENRVKGFSNIPDWVSFLKNMDFCLNSRFHGNVACILAGVPSVMIPIDSRTDELVRYHSLPSVSMADVESIRDIYELIAKTDFLSCKRIGEENLYRYFEFLDANGIQHVGEKHQLDFIKNKIISREMWFRELNMKQKMNRIVRYYAKRMSNKMVNRNKTLIK